MEQHGGVETLLTMVRHVNDHRIFLLVTPYDGIDHRIVIGCGIVVFTQTL
jgi:hypothetical protein